VFLRLHFAFLFVCLGLLSSPVYALDIPSLDSPVIDEVGTLGAGAQQQLTKTIEELRNKTGIQLQVYVIKSLEGDSIDSVAIQVFDKWKLGDEKTDRGLLFLIAPNEMRMRIEVGQGLEGDMPDVIGKRIISDVVRPYFQRGEYGLGVAQGVLTIENYLTNTDPAKKAEWQKNAESKTGQKSGGFWIIIIMGGIWLIIFMVNPSLALMLLFSAMRGGGGGGSGGGGSWSGGGGRSSGGGASGSW
jgi:uncharacterized protein